MPLDAWVVVFAKAPVAGRVKTRLAAEVGPEMALRVYQRMAEPLWRALLASRAELGYGLCLAYDPPEAAASMKAWLPGADAYLPQRPGNLGERLAAALRWSLDQGTGRVTVIGTDCPGFTPEHLRQGFQACDAHPFVLGPAADGGFYALTLTPDARGLLDALPGIPWSSPDTASSLLAAAEALGLKGASLPELRDLDTLADLTFHRRAFGWG